MNERKGPAYRIETGRLLIRCMSPADAPLLRALLDEADSYLRPWIPWMKDEPQSLEQTVQRLRGYRAEFDLDRGYRYFTFGRDDGRLVGIVGLHDRIGPGGLEIGYLLHPAAAGKGYAFEAAAAMVRVAFETRNVDRVEIHCDPRNTPSAKLPARLGFTLEATLKRRNENAEGEICDSMIWTLFREQYGISPAKASPLAAFDALDRQIL